MYRLPLPIDFLPQASFFRHQRVHAALHLADMALAVAVLAQAELFQLALAAAQLGDHLVLTVDEMLAGHGEIVADLALATKWRGSRWLLIWGDVW